MKILLVLLCVLCINSTLAKTDYCQFQCRNPTIKHIGCTAQMGVFAKECINPYMVPMDRAKQNLFLELHNQKRNDIAGGVYKGYPYACRMAALQWDNELAELAALNVQNCQGAHDNCHETDLFKTAGQNIARYNTNKPADPGTRHPFDETAKIAKAVDTWFEEIKYFNPNNIGKLPHNYDPVHRFGHFTQLVTGINTRIGCAISTYSKDNNNFILIVCNYSKLIAEGSPVYEACPSPAMKCARKHDSYGNLCDPSEIYDENLP